MIQDYSYYKKIQSLSPKNAVLLDLIEVDIKETLNSDNYFVFEDNLRFKQKPSN